MWWRDELTADGLDLLINGQDGVVSRCQLLTGGWSDVGIRRAFRQRRWQSVFPGVYSIFTGELTYQQRILAGLLYAGTGAMWSHHTAAEQQGLIAIRQDRPVHVTVPQSRRVQPQPGLVVHRSRSCADRVDNVVPPRSTPAHAVVDVVSITESLDETVAVLAEACQSGHVSAAAVGAALRGRRQVRFRRELAPMLEAVAAGSHSLLEVRYLREVERRHNLPRGVRQRAVDGEFTDVAYQQYGVVVELDGRLHLDPKRRWRDMDRDNRAAMRSERTLRFGWVDVTGRPCKVAAQVLSAQRLSGAPDDARPCGQACPVRPQRPVDAR